MVVMAVVGSREAVETGGFPFSHSLSLLMPLLRSCCFSHSSSIGGGFEPGTAVASAVVLSPLAAQGELSLRQVGCMELSCGDLVAGTWWQQSWPL